jgi:hypothetical protein
MMPFVAGRIGEPRFNVERVIEHAMLALPHTRAAAAARPGRKRLRLNPEERCEFFAGVVQFHHSPPMLALSR